MPRSARTGIALSLVTIMAVHAAPPSLDMDREVSLRHENALPSEVVSDLARQGRCRIAIAAAPGVLTGSRVSLVCVRRPLREAVQRLCEKMGATHTVVGDMVVLRCLRSHAPPALDRKSRGELRLGDLILAVAKLLTSEQKERMIQHNGLRVSELSAEQQRDLLKLLGPKCDQRDREAFQRTPELVLFRISFVPSVSVHQDGSELPGSPVNLLVGGGVE